MNMAWLENEKKMGAVNERTLSGGGVQEIRDNSNFLINDCFQFRFWPAPRSPIRHGQIKTI